MIGQNNLKNYIRSFVPSLFPDVTLLIGEVGSGRRTIVNEEIAKLLELEVKDITNNISYKEIGEFYLSPISYIYLIDLDDISIKKQNLLLKFIEDSPKGSKIILLSSNEAQIIGTVLSRCTVMRLDKYSEEELLMFCDDRNLIRVLRTPGKLLNSSVVSNVGVVKDLAKNIILKSKSATFSNLLSVSSKVSFDVSDTTKIDVGTFNSILIFEASELFKERQIDGVQYKLISDYVNSQSCTLSKFDKFLTEFKFNEY